MRNWTLGAKALSMRPPETITPLKIVTGLAPKFTTHALQMGPMETDRESYVYIQFIYEHLHMLY